MKRHITHVLVLDGCREDGDGPAVGGLDQLDTVQVRVVHLRRTHVDQNHFDASIGKPEESSRGLLRAGGRFTWHSGCPRTTNNMLTAGVRYTCENWSTSWTYACSNPGCRYHLSWVDSTQIRPRACRSG